MWRRALRGRLIKSSTGWALLAVFGLTLAMAGARVQEPESASGDVLVWVNDRPITSDRLNEVEARLNGVFTDDADRRALIDLLIDEELLLQRAERLGVVDGDPGVRKAVVQAAIRQIVEEFLATPPEQKQLEQYYSHHRAVFKRPARVAVAALRFDDVTAAQHALVSGGGSWADLEARPDATPVSYLPNAPLPVHVLRRYLGPGPANAALSLTPGSISHPVEGPGGAYLLQVTHSVSPSVPGFSDIEAVVLEEYLSRGREAALTDRLAELWRAADIELNDRVAPPGDYVRRSEQ